jgi:hypothetical protein
MTVDEHSLMASHAAIDIRRMPDEYVVLAFLH